MIFVGQGLREVSRSYCGGCRGITHNLAQFQPKGNSWGSFLGNYRRSCPGLKACWGALGLVFILPSAILAWSSLGPVMVLLLPRYPPDPAFAGPG
jgi:hypothetical protein